jgi:hypothetical protein
MYVQVCNETKRGHSFIISLTWFWPRKQDEEEDEGKINEKEIRSKSNEINWQCFLLSVVVRTTSTVDSRRKMRAAVVAGDSVTKAAWLGRGIVAIYPNRSSMVENSADRVMTVAIEIDWIVAVVVVACDEAFVDWKRH